MRIDILVLPDCPHRATTSARVRAALKRAGIDASVHEIEVATALDAAFQHSGIRSLEFT